MSILNKLKERVFHRNVQNEDFSLQNIINADTHFSVIESYKTARTNIMFTLAEETGCKKILVTSPTSGEGKSTTTLNMAITFAQTGARVIVLDADLRCPRLHTYLELKEGDGLAQYLGGFNENYHEVIQHVPQYKLDCIIGGTIPPNPSELLISPAMEQLLKDLSEEYDYIIVDSPPVNLVTDSISMAKHMSGAVLVVRQDYTTSESLKQAVASLEFGHIKVLGYLLNDAQGASSHSYKNSHYRTKYYR